MLPRPQKTATIVTHTPTVIDKNIRPISCGNCEQGVGVQGAQMDGLDPSWIPDSWV